MINKELANLNINVITKIGIKKSTVNQLYKLQIRKVGDLDKVEQKDLTPILESDKSITYAQFISVLQLDLVGFVNEVEKTITADPTYEMAQLHMQNHTYQEIARVSAISKEKAVQSIDKFLQSLYPLVDALGEKLIKDKSFIELTEVEEVIPSKEFCNILILTFKRHTTKWTYNHKLKIITKNV
ncbi:MAG: hypothetical protein Q4D21_08010 [Phascolarctobacterium sp.]|nr:hypothetical protein [Phascolarctobacterium sp.]